MSSICLSFHVHQPFVLRRYSVFDSDEHYFDGYRSREACRKFAIKSILPTNRILLGLIRRYPGRFCLSCTVSGTALDLFERYSPDVLDSFRELSDTGNVEFLAMPYHNALSFLYSETAFAEQVEMHRRRTGDLFGRQPHVFRNSEMIYGDDLADAVSSMGFAAVVCDGAGEVLAGRPCSRVYIGGRSGLPLLLRNGRLSRDVSERFTDRQWDQWPLTAPKFAEWLSRFSSPEELVNLGWDYATFGLENDAETGILDFLRYLPQKVLDQPGLEFLTVSQAVERHQPVGEYRPGYYVSTAERRGNLSAWLGNPMQSHAMHRLFALEAGVREGGSARLLDDWRRLQACEYFEAMSTGPAEPQRQGGGFGRPDSPYDGYINFMNICDNLASRVESPAAIQDG